MEALQHFLRLLVEKLLGHLIPREAEVTQCRDQAQPDDTSGRQKHIAFVAIGVFPFQILPDGLMREIAGGDDMRN